jgi:DNA invertase Pin-like site-specific DNA recombinase
MGTAVAVIGYARVSTMEQNLDLQLTALQAAGAARIFADNGVNGSTTEHPPALQGHGSAGGR